MRSRLRTGAVLGALLTAALALPAAAPAATGWTCAAGALTGSVLGQAVPGAVTAGSATEECTTGQGLAPLTVPPLLDVGTLAASTAGTPTSAFASGGVVDLAIRAAPELPIALPPIAIPPELTNVEVELAGIPVAQVDLTPAIQAALPGLQVPSTELVSVKGAVATATGVCQDGAPAFDGTSQVAEVRIAGQEVGTSALVDRVLTLADTQQIDLTALDLTLAEVTLLGLPVDVSTAQIVAALPITTLEVPATLAQVTVTPGGQTRTADGLAQSALRVQAAVAGVEIADLALGQAAVAASGVDCTPGEQVTPPAQQDAEDLALACTKRRIVLIDVLRRGSRVKLLGAADKQYAGRTARIVFAATGRTVARARIREDGGFSTTAPLPAARIRGTNRARYRAVVAGERSLNLKLTRRMVVDSVRSSGGRVRIRGRVIGPLARPVRPILVKRRVTCERTVTVARVRPRRDGRFSVSVKAPENRAAAVYRLSTKVRLHTGGPGLYPTFTLPRAVDL